ncbi:MAG: hypothetical protein R8K50_10740, partial [Mariprofundus sp.]
MLIHLIAIHGTSHIISLKRTLSDLLNTNFSYISSKIRNKSYFFAKETIFSKIFLSKTFQVGLSGFITKIPAIFGLYFTLFSKSFKSGFHQF